MQPDVPSRARPRPPSKLLLMAEWRAAAEFALGLASVPLLMTARRGDGHPVLVLPGFLVSDFSTEMLRRYLSLLGYQAHGWALGFNLGGVYRMRRVLPQRVHELRRQTGRTVSLVGWSLGGVYARDLALAVPGAVRSVITLGSPFNEHARANNAGRWYDRISGESIDAAHPDDRAALAGDLPVPTTSIYSRADGVVSWRASVLRENGRAENIEVLGASHLGLGVNPAVLWAIADRLAQPEGRFRHFGRMGPFALAYARVRNGRSNGHA